MDDEKAFMAMSRLWAEEFDLKIFAYFSLTQMIPTTQHPIHNFENNLQGAEPYLQGTELFIRIPYLNHSLCVLIRTRKGNKASC